MPFLRAWWGSSPVFGGDGPLSLSVVWRSFWVVRRVFRSGVLALELKSPPTYQGGRQGALKAVAPPDPRLRSPLPAPTEHARAPEERPAPPLPMGDRATGVASCLGDGAFSTPRLPSSPGTALASLPAVAPFPLPEMGIPRPKQVPPNDRVRIPRRDRNVCGRETLSRIFGCTGSAAPQPAPDG